MRTISCDLSLDFNHVEQLNEKKGLLAPVSPSCNKHAAFLLLQPEGKPAFYTASPVPERDQSWARCLAGSRCPAHFSHTGPPSDSSPWYRDCLPDEQSPRAGSSGGERQQKLPKGSKVKKRGSLDADAPCTTVKGETKSEIKEGK